MNARMNISKKIKVPDLDNLELMIERAYHEVNPLYPVPKIFTREDFRKLYLKITEIGG